MDEERRTDSCLCAALPGGLERADCQETGGEAQARLGRSASIGQRLDGEEEAERDEEGGGCSSEEVESHCCGEKIEGGDGSEGGSMREVASSIEDDALCT